MRFGIAPMLHGIGHVDIGMGGLEGDRVRTLGRAGGGVRVRIFRRDDRMAAIADREAGPPARLPLGRRRP